MLKVFILFILLIAGVVLGPMIAGHQGYVLIQTDNWNIETSVTGLVIILIISLLVILAVEWLLRRVLHTGARTRGWFTGRKRRRAQRHTQSALMKLAEGDHRQVEKLLSKDADHADVPVANYLLAAEAAQQRGDELAIAGVHVIDPVVHGDVGMIGLVRRVGVAEQGLSHSRPALGARKPRHQHRLRLP